MPTSSAHVVALLGVSLLAACVQPSPPAAEREQQATRDTPPTEPSPAAPSQPPAMTRARAYVAVDGVGLHVIDDQGWRRLLEARSSIRDMLVVDGQLLVLSGFGVQRVDADGNAETIAPPHDPFGRLGDPLALASADGRELWVAGALGVARHSGNWQLTPVEASNPTHVDLAVDRGNHPWLLFDSLFRHRDDRWLPVTLDSKPVAVLADPRGEGLLVHAGCDTGARRCVLLRMTADQPATRIELPIGDCPEHDRMAVSRDGTRAVIAGRCGLIRLNLDGDADPQPLGLDDGWPGQPLRGLALDDGGRIWASTHNGVTIVATDNAVNEYPIAKLDDVAGVVGSIVIEAEGPPPPPLTRVRVGGLAGTLVVGQRPNQRPLANVQVELCDRLAPGADLQVDPTRSPCAGVDSIHTTTTDGEGRFKVDDLTIGHHHIGVEIDGRWARARPKALTMRAGMTGDVGKIVVDLD